MAASKPTKKMSRTEQQIQRNGGNGDDETSRTLADAFILRAITGQWTTAEVMTDGKYVGVAIENNKAPGDKIIMYGSHLASDWTETKDALKAEHFMDTQKWSQITEKLWKRKGGNGTKRRTLQGLVVKIKTNSEYQPYAFVLVEELDEEDEVLDDEALYWQIHTGSRESWPPVPVYKRLKSQRTLKDLEWMEQPCSDDADTMEMFASRRNRVDRIKRVMTKQAPERQHE